MDVVAADGEAAPAPTLSSLPDVLVVEIVGQCTCHIGLASLAGASRGLCCLLLGASAGAAERRIECLYPSACLIDERLASLTEARGWVPFADVGQTPLAPLRWKSSQRLYYARRMASLPLPHAAWSTEGGARELPVGTRMPFRTVGEALVAARDGDTLRLEPERFVEAEPLVIKHSVRLVGAPHSSRGDTRRPNASTLCATLCIEAGQVSICGLTLRLPPDGPHPPAGGVTGGGGEGGGADDGGAGESTVRCLTVGCAALVAVEDCLVHGGVRAGAQAELALVNCAISGGEASAGGRGTGVLVQGRARALIRSSRVVGHARSGITVQQSGRLWLQASEVSDNSLAGLKLLSSAPCLLSTSLISGNRHMAVMLRERADVRVHACRVAANALGVACIQNSALSLSGCELLDNSGFGPPCVLACLRACVLACLRAASCAACSRAVRTAGDLILRGGG